MPATEAIATSPTAPSATPDERPPAAKQRLALAKKAEPVAPLRNPATASLLAAAMQSATRGEWDRAQAALERAVKLSPDDHGLWRELAYTHYREGDLDAALVIAERALSLSRGRVPGESQSVELIEDIKAAQRRDAGSNDAESR